MELRHLRYFLAVAEELHFGRAAQRLHMSQPPLSQQIQALEQELGVQLFERGRRQIQLTAPGQIFLAATREILQDVDKAVLATQRASRGEMGLLQMGFVSTYAYGVLPQIFQRFRATFPDIQLDLHEMHLPTQLQNLQDRELDIGFMPLPIQSTDLDTLCVQREPMLAVLPSVHPLAHHQDIPLESLAHEPFIFFPRALAPEYYDQLWNLFQQAGFEPHVIQEANSMSAIVNLVAVGMGVSLLPSTVRSLQREGVAYLGIRGTEYNVRLGAVWHKNNRSPALQSFLSLLRNYCLGS